METRLGRAVLLVQDYEEAYQFYNLNLGCRKLFDMTTEDGQRFLHIGFGEGDSVGLWLLKADKEEEQGRVGLQTGRQPAFVFYTSSLEEVYQRLLRHQVRIVKDPVTAPDAKFLHFLDLYGNEIVLVELLT
ncbi:MAG: VOC family protein [Hymenobacteraceae bacterium]|nr:VOC family protein [Hymenobacteraceae bacterium]